MKFYIAGKFEEKDQIHALIKRITDAGHELSYDWTTHVKVKPFEENVERARTYAENEIDGILNADVFLSLSHERGTTLHMEFGAALAKKWQGGAIKIYIVGEHNNRSIWYFNNLVKRVDTVEEALADLGIE